MGLKLKIYILLSVLNFAHSEFNFDVNDILNVNLMPGSLLMFDNQNAPNFSNITLGAPLDNSTINVNGTFNEAFATMGFHRKMMNEYLCRNFLADQILEEIVPAKLNRRMGSRPTPFTTPVPTVSTGKRKGRVSTATAVKENLLTDPGSSSYKDWLSKTTTLEDIYRHYGGVKEKVDNGLEDTDSDTTNREDFDNDVTGFAVQGIVNPLPPPTRIVPIVPNMPKVGSGYGGGGGGGQTGYGQPSGGYAAAPAQQYAIPSGHGHMDYHQHYEAPAPAPPQHFVHYHHGSNKKEMILKDLFDIALTALAFLSFGVFAIQVILCIAATKTTTTPAAMMMMMETSAPTATAPTGTGTDPTATAPTGQAIIISNDEPFPTRRPIPIPDVYNGYYDRQRRETTESMYSDNSLANELARRVLVTMEAVFIANQDDGNCLRHKICENNKYSRTVENNQKIWIPVYGLALSWLSGRVTTTLPPAPAMLESLKASALGLGNADCDAIYPDCDLTKLREIRRRRRRKRSDNNNTNSSTAERN